MDRENLRLRLSSVTPVRLSDPGRGQAAVLIALRWKAGVPHFVLTRRTDQVATHKGQISFPGGVREPTDLDLITTALRETSEEIGIDSATVDVIGEFHDYRAITGHSVRTVVGILDDQVEYRLHAVEVAYVLEIPVSFFSQEPFVEHRLHQGKPREVLFYHFADEVVWGLTALIIRDFIRSCESTPIFPSGSSAVSEE